MLTGQCTKAATCAALYVVIWAIVVGCSTRPGLAFSVEGCTSAVNAYTAPSEGILNSSWASQDVLVVEGYLKTFCSGAIISGDYRSAEDNLFLTYSVTTIGPVTTCNCAHKVSYRISGLEHRQYSIFIEQSK